MRYTSYETAAYAARRELLPHKVVKTRYWSCDLWDWVPCWTVVLCKK
jgi:hypothetical protein